MRDVKTEIANYNVSNTQTRVKPEPGIFMRHRHSKSDESKIWNYVHRSGRPCPSGADGTCQHKKRDDDTLPDLPESTNEIGTLNSASTNPRSVVTLVPQITIKHIATKQHSISDNQSTESRSHKNRHWYSSLRPP